MTTRARAAEVLPPEARRVLWERLWREWLLRARPDAGAPATPAGRPAAADDRRPAEGRPD